MGTKQFMNINEQLEILKSRGLIINDEEKAKIILIRENYFFLSGYRHVFLKTLRINFKIITTITWF